ncbi:LCP family protein, partial [Streptococcus pyogenes]
VKGPKKEKIKKQKVKKQLPVREILASDTVQEEKVRKPRKKVNWFKRIFKIIIWAILLTLIGLLFMFIKGYSSIEHKAKPETFQGQ